MSWTPPSPTRPAPGAAGPEEGAPGAAQRPRVQSVARAAALLLSVARSPSGLTSKELSDQLGLSRQTTYHLLHTLVAVGLLTRGERNRYVVGLRVGSLAEAFKRHLAPSEYLAPYVRRIARETGETAYAAGWWNGEIVILGMARGDQAVQAAELPYGVYSSGHARASGKLLLAFATPDLREDYFRRNPLVACTPNTITDRRRLDAELEAIRRQGFAEDRAEFAEGLCCLAVPIDGGLSPFVFGLSAPVERFAENRAAYLARMRAVADSISIIPLADGDGE